MAKRIPDLARPEESVRLVAHPDDDGMRLDCFLKKRFARISRSKFQVYIDAGRARINGRVAKSHSPVREDNTVVVDWPLLRGIPADPAKMRFEILQETDDIVVINKPPGLVVHPAGKHRYDTLMNALATNHPEGFESDEGTWRLLHRLDKDTSGLVLVAKGLAAKRELQPLFEERRIEKEYLAIVEGDVRGREGVIRLPIGHDRPVRGGVRMKIDHVEGKPAETAWEAIERFEGFALVAARPKTGRQHQIRIHLAAALGTPIVGDVLYGGRRTLSAEDLGLPARDSPLLARQALHCRRMSFVHPRTQSRTEFTAALPADFAAALEALRAMT